MARKYCPSCNSILSSIILLANFDAPNEHRINSYICEKCSKSSGLFTIYCFSSTCLTIFKQKSKFPSAVKYAEKLINYFQSKQQPFLIDAKIQKKSCCYCKESLLYDKDSSIIKPDIQIRSFFHFDCKGNSQHQQMFFFISQQIKNIQINRVIIG